MTIFINHYLLTYVVFQTSIAKIMALQFGTAHQYDSSGRQEMVLYQHIEYCTRKIQRG